MGCADERVGEGDCRPEPTKIQEVWIFAAPSRDGVGRVERAATSGGRRKRSEIFCPVIKNWATLLCFLPATLPVFVHRTAQELNDGAYSSRKVSAALTARGTALTGGFWVFQCGSGTARREGGRPSATVLRVAEPARGDAGGGRDGLGGHSGAIGAALSQQERARLAGPRAHDRGGEGGEEGRRGRHLRRDEEVELL